VVVEAGEEAAAAQDMQHTVDHIEEVQQNCTLAWCCAAESLDAARKGASSCFAVEEEEGHLVDNMRSADAVEPSPGGTEAPFGNESLAGLENEKAGANPADIVATGAAVLVV